MNNKTSITLAVLFISLSSFTAGYFLMPKANLNRQTGTLIERFKSDPDIYPPDDKIPNTLPISGGKFMSFTDLFSDSEKLVAADRNGKIIEIDTENLTETGLADLRYNNISEVTLSPAGNSVFYSFYDARNNQKHLYSNFKGDKSVDMTEDIRSVAFSPRGDRLAYLVNKGVGGELLISKEGNIQKRMLKTRLNNAVIDWPSDNLISIISYDKDGYGDLFTLNETGELNKVVSYQSGLGIKWSPSGEKVAFSSKSDIGSYLLFYQDIKNNGTAVDLETNTYASKCTWVDDNDIICGVTDKTGLKDEFFKINLTDGSKTLVSTPSVNLLTKEISISRSGEVLFVLNNIDSELYALKIK